ncbi:MAG: hypothetical protein K5905_29130 [Roseibium sp.]|uniref:hypothetical protein n=1 Tax=Roseibium sp. TaxID=1936156 RepID=UPI00260E75DD|nr:hypothetical protein [Roseibium sp.]MCV0429523.1 hypothetical protein [Roseibium sp.]
MHCKTAFFIISLVYSNSVAGQEFVDHEFYKSYFSDPSIIVLHRPRPFKAGDLIRYFSAQDHRLHSLTNCTRGPLTIGALSQRAEHDVNQTGEGNDWQKTVVLGEGDADAALPSKNIVTRRDTVEYASPDEGQGKFRARSETLSVALIDLRNSLNVYLCPKYDDWSSAVDGLAVPETVYWFEGEVKITSRVALKLESRITLSAENLAPVVKQAPWAEALMKSIKADRDGAKEVSVETSMIARFPTLKQTETPTALAFRPLYINPEIAKQISDFYQTMSKEFGGVFTPEEARSILEREHSLNLKTENSLINKVFSPSEIVFREWTSGDTEIAERNRSIARNIKQAIYLNYLASRAD